MNAENQANRLAKLMAKQQHIPSYELAFPPISIRSTKFQKLEVGDIFLLGLKHFTCLLLDDTMIYAEVTLCHEDNREYFKITKRIKAPDLSSGSKKYETVKCTFGNIQCRVLEVGHRIDIGSLDLHHVDVIYNGKRFATASLVNVNDEIAVKINKINKEVKDV